MLAALITQSEAIEVPRCDRRVEHKLVAIRMIAARAMVGKAERFEDVARYGRCRRDQLQGFPELADAIPSHDASFGWVASLIPSASAAGMTHAMTWTKLCESSPSEYPRSARASADLRSWAWPSGGSCRSKVAAVTATGSRCRRPA